MRGPVPTARQALLGAVVVGAFASFGGIGCAEKDSLIVVTASTADYYYAPGLHTLVVSAGNTTKSFHITGDLTYGAKVGLYVPSSLTGRNILVKAQAVSPTGCGPGYSGTTTVDIPAAGATVDATIIMVDAQTCPPTGGTGGTTGTGGTGGSTGGSNGEAKPDFSRCTEIDHGTTGTCASCTIGDVTDVSVYGVAISPNSATVVTGGTDGRVKIWSNTSGTLTAVTALTGTGLGTVAFSPDGSMLAVGRIGGTDIVNTSTWSVIRTLVTAAGQEAYSVAFSPDGTDVFTLAAPMSGTGVTGTLFAHAVGNVNFLSVVSVTVPYGMAVPAVTVSGVVPVAVTDANGDVSIYNWSAVQGTFASPIQLTVTANGSTAEAAAFSPHATVFAAGGDDGILSLWNFPAAAGARADGQIAIGTLTSSSYIGAVAFSPKAGYVGVGGSFFGTLTAYNLTDGTQVGIEYPAKYDLLAMAFSPDYNVIVGGEYDCGCVVVCPQ